MKMNGFADVSTMEMEMVDGGASITDQITHAVVGAATAAANAVVKAVDSAVKAVNDHVSVSGSAQLRVASPNITPKVEVDNKGKVTASVTASAGPFTAAIKVTF